ncbi:MAG: hypothetical protein JSV64_02610 [Candidatus Bathyarchaeota archaeon]|nr:MAG: hypothetical protein JSV64_02610 [Candidatus Bathyarchaeota archaeon]
MNSRRSNIIIFIVSAITLVAFIFNETQLVFAFTGPIWESTVNETDILTITTIPDVNDDDHQDARARHLLWE